MACNSWDKLCKAQRDYPKAKFADSFVQKSLKKSPKNPFLLAWKADISLQLTQDPKNVLLQVQQAWQQPGPYDIRLLAYLYRLSAEAMRRSNATNTCMSGLGNENSKVWLSASKTLSPQERQELWSALGKVAWHEQCWEDFRFAVVQYSKELKDTSASASMKKHTHFIQILATQLAAEQQLQIPGASLKSKVQFELARRLLKQSYEASPDEPIACKDIRDLRFMGEIFARQRKCDELIELWNNPPATLKDLMTTHQADLQIMRIRLSRESKHWSLVESESRARIENAISQITENPDSKALWELCAWNVDLWTDWLAALRINLPKNEAIRTVNDVLHRAFGTELRTNDRAMSLTYMKLRHFVGVPMAGDCLAYWKNHSTLTSCFTDIRPFLETLHNNHGPGGKSHFFQSLNTVISSTTGNKYTQEQCNIHSENIMKITHLITSPVAEKGWQGDIFNVLKYILKTVCKSSGFYEPSSSGGFLAVYSLLRMHYVVMRYEESQHPFENTPNSRLLLQAAMLARHLVACDKEKQDRPRALLAARIHLNLGLGKSAFQMYSYTKCKEMLVHTISPYVLSRLSITHPFGAKGYQGFSAEEELGKAIGTMERMESKTDDTIYPDLKTIPWDQAIGLLSLRGKLKSSSTKHICNLERRRIARLKGEPVDQLPVLDRQSFQNIVDNVDRCVFPDFDDTQSSGPLPYVMPNVVPNLPWLIESYSIWEASSRVLYKETQTWEDVGLWVDEIATPKEGHQVETNNTPAESRAEKSWLGINTIVVTMAGQADPKLLPGVLTELSEELHAMRLAMEKLRMPNNTNLKLDDEPTMFHENMLISCYTKLEILRALIRTDDLLREKVLSPKSTHPLKSKLPKNWVSEIETETKLCYDAIRDVVHSYINLIEKKGVAAIKAQVRWGETGEILKSILSDSDVEAYALEYVDSALHAWKGVLQVKLR
ncbi:hypothetical protein COCMIDRAFT_104795 [Bipolaris oryzae ATCC 44560]|uniref:Uncharacterized protein n=1 Tax=Bipolaris oryzae ATCC 44560 TaxID=930090 RepID=W6ZEK8_COCMI|nr:uncharacterized protein COCMIDRAFT_104795 [Bipolaris oryzae ATCC 44560]EUC41961.1 hypothetical protein COCMIDRAFT_104795 [Bipolaris oryzae ATCC 44560]